jgi:putative spermidine/putrescine transport system ATP-binding protein
LALAAYLTGSAFVRYRSVPIVEFTQVSKRFGSVEAIQSISFAIRRGEFFSLLGPSGCGKTTTLRLLAGLEEPDSGDIRIAGASAVALRPYERRLGMVFQSYALFPHLSVERNIAYGLERQGTTRAEILARVARALELVRLLPAEFAGRRPAELSGGQRQRVALARALVLEPEILLLDEPLGAIDLKLRKEMQVELKQLNRALGTTFVYVTHDQDEALTMSDRIAVMDRGRIAQLGTPAEVYETPRTVFVAGFIGESNLFGTTGQRIAVRPERICLLARGEPPPGQALQGTVAEVIYLGDRIRILVTILDGSRVTVLLSNDGRVTGPPIWAQGDAVQVCWRAEDGHVVEEQ